MRTNGFALFRGPRREELMEKAFRGMQRFCTERTIGSGPGFEDWSGVPDSADECVLAYALDESRGLPIVHGFLEDAWSGQEMGGEYALLAQRDGVLVASRDKLGTRPLYTDRTGSCIASDHRFFRDVPQLLPNGVSLRTDSMKPITAALRKDEAHGTIDECAAELAKILEGVVASRVRGRRKVAVSFSGGLDSSLIAMIAARAVEVVLCSAYAPRSRDQRNVQTAADSLGLELVGVEIDRATAAEELRSLDLPFDTTPMDRALWCIYSAAAREAAAHGAELIMLGQLADELFGGYMKYAHMARENEEGAAAMMNADVFASGERAFIRDEEACARFSEARFPFADEKLVAFALGVPVGYKVREGERKVVLRKAASILGLPDNLASAPKKAAQYSSGVAKLIP